MSIKRFWSAVFFKRLTSISSLNWIVSFFRVFKEPVQKWVALHPITNMAFNWKIKFFQFFFRLKSNDKLRVFVNHTCQTEKSIVVKALAKKTLKNFKKFCSVADKPRPGARKKSPIVTKITCIMYNVALNIEKIKCKIDCMLFVLLLQQDPNLWLEPVSYTVLEPEDNHKTEKAQN